MKKVLLALVVFLSALSVSSNASALVNVDARYWFTDLESDIMISNGAVGTDIDFVDDLGIDGRKGFFEGRITLELGGHKLRYAYMPLKWDGSRTISTDVTFGGDTFTASTLVDSKLEMDYHRLGYEYDIIDTLDNRLGVIFEIKYLDGEASLRADAAGKSETEAFKLPLPAVGVSAQVGLPFLFSVGGEVTGITLGSYAYLIDGEAMVNLKPAPFVVISGGYRILKIHAEKDLDRGDITVQGPFLNVRADF